MNKPPEYLKVWIYLLSEAFFKDKEGLKRGQGYTSLPDIMDVLTYKVGYRTERPTKKKVFGIIEWLRNPNEGYTNVPMIVTTKVTHGFIYTIENYDLYQTIENYEGNNEGSTKVKRRADVGNNIKKNVKECKNEKKLHTEVFDYYKENCKSLPQALKLTEARKKSINARISDYSFDEVLETLDKAEKSDFLVRGKENSWLNFDWVFNPNNFIKILEGKYNKEKPKETNIPSDDNLGERRENY